MGTVLKTCYGCGLLKNIGNSRTRCKQCRSNNVPESNYGSSRVKKGPFIGWLHLELPKCIEPSQSSSSARPLDYHQRDIVIKALGYVDYQDYLKSELWYSIRNRLLPSKCSCGCGAYANQIHHRFYTEQNLLGDSLNGLVALHSECHQSIEYSNTKKNNLLKANSRLKRKIRLNGKRLNK